MIDFICSRVESQTPPQTLLDQVLPVLDEEAEPFVMKLWQMLIFLVRKAEATGAK